MSIFLQGFILSLLFSSLAFAAPSAKQKTEHKVEQKSELKIQKPNVFKEWIKQRASVSIFFATADSMNSEGFNSNATSGWSTLSSSPSFGISAQLADRRWQKVSWYTNTSFEQEHELKNLKTGTQAGVQTLTFNSKPGFRSLILGAGFLLHFHKTDKYYYSAGLNYPLLTETHAGDFSSFSLQSQVGWQLFAAMRLKKEIAVEAGWREIRYNMQAVKNDGTAMQFGLQSFGGVSITGRYSF